jgi:hypothetical protein
LSIALANAAACGLIAIVVDNNSRAWLIGWSENDLAKRPLYLEDNELDSGDLPGAESGNSKFTLKGENDQIDIPCNDTINTYIAACIAAGTDVGFTP